MTPLRRRLRRWLSARRRARFLVDYGAAVSDIQLALQAKATASTADYVAKHMRSVQSVATWQDVHAQAAGCVSLPDGLCLEFGVFQGRTARFIAGLRDWQVHGFDSFEGLPDDWRDGYSAGTFKLDTLPRVPSNVVLHKGWFEDTLPAFLSGLGPSQPPIAYLHIDCDLHSSAQTVLQALKPRIVSGTVIVFDEYFNYDGWQEGEFKAFHEFIAQTQLGYDYITYNRTQQQVALIIR